MHDHVATIMTYTVNGKNNFVCMKCDDCGHTHFVSTRDDLIVIASEDANAEKYGIFCF